MSDPVTLAAQDYTARGWAVFPVHRISASGGCTCGITDCGSPGKHPPTGSRGFHDAVLDPTRFRWPGRNIAIATGRGLHVVDVDTKAGAVLSAVDEGWLLTDGSGNDVCILPPSRVVRTGSGGWHWYGTVDGKVRNSSGSGKKRSIGLGIDSRGDGGYVLAPPSNHVAGEYVVLSDHELAPLPAELLSLLADAPPVLRAVPSAPRSVPQSYAARALAAECRAVASEPEGGRNNRLNIAAFNLGQLVSAGVLASGDVESDLLSAALQAGIERHAAAKTIASGITAGTASGPRQIPERPARPAPQTVEPDVVDPDDWRALLLKDSRGVPIGCPDNARIVLSCHPEWRGCLTWDEFQCRAVWVKEPPACAAPARRPSVGDRLADSHATFAQLWLGQAFKRQFSLVGVYSALESAAHDYPSHPLREWLQGLTWDGTPRLSSWLVDYLGAAATDHHRRVGLWWLVSAVARIMQPGCQVDHMLVLEGATGSGKTTAMQVLAGEYYLGTMPDIRDGKAAAEALAGKWIVEVAELQSIKGASATRIKEFLSQRWDHYRPAYGRNSITQPRQCVFGGTTNERHYLDDPTGSRRFWPVLCGGLDRDALSRDREQLLAEAVAEYRAGARWHPTRDEAVALAVEQESRFAVDELESVIGPWAAGWTEFTMADVFEDCLKLDKGRWDRSIQTRIGNILTRLGYVARQISRNGARVRAYSKAVLR